ncbi:MAG TPA: PilZ domain-containing protein [Terriglobales bacterium]|nr:PilZ domain-containing protein [Terriglobales bacterium]HUL14892.1 PilZ domain-containing protein [Terriglobales bacterium]
MSATNRAPQLQPLRKSEPEAKACASVVVEKTRSLLGTPALESPALKVLPLLRPESPRRFVRVPTHAVGVFPEHREYPRASLRLPLRLRSVNRIPEDFPITLVTRDISSTGVYFLCPKQIALNTPIELEIVLVSRPMGRGNVVIVTLAHVRRTEPAAMPGWHGIAASYDDVQFDRDDGIPSRFLFP